MSTIFYTIFILNIITYMTTIFYTKCNYIYEYNSYMSTIFYTIFILNIITYMSTIFI